MDHLHFLDWFPYWQPSNHKNRCYRKCTVVLDAISRGTNKKCRGSAVAELSCFSLADNILRFTESNALLKAIVNERIVKVLIYMVLNRQQGICADISSPVRKLRVGLGFVSMARTIVIIHLLTETCAEISCHNFFKKLWHINPSIFSIRTHLIVRQDQHQSCIFSQESRGVP